MGSLEYIVKKFNLRNLNGLMPVEIPNFGRDQMADLFCELGFNVGAEIGVREGFYSEILCKANPHLLLYSIDPYESYTGYNAKRGKMDATYRQAVDLLGRYNCKLIKAYSTEAAVGFEDRSLDFVYIDANHDYAHVIEDLQTWCPKVKKGGIISGHDWLSFSTTRRLDVKTALRTYTQLHNISPWFVLGRKECLPGEIRDRFRSWMWVN